MGTKTGIEWTDTTWNPIRGCSPVSPGCKNCYASGIAKRFSGPGAPYEGLVRINANGERTDEWNGVVQPVPEHLLDPLKWKRVLASCVQCGSTKTCVCRGRDIAGPLGPHWRSRRIFVNSMSDLFHENLPDEEIDKVFAMMALCPQHAFQVLTKRPQRMLEYLTPARWERIRVAAALLTKTMQPEWSWPLPNVHLGVSCENQATADERIPLLLQTPAAVRFISAEPLLGAIDIRRWIGTECRHDDSYSELDTNATICRECDDLEFLDWVICGGESGPGARPMHPDWARSLRDQCVAAGVPFFFKQWGEWLPAMGDGADLAGSRTVNCSDDPVRVGKKVAGSLLDGREWKQFPGAAR